MCVKAVIVQDRQKTLQMQLVGAKLLTERQLLIE